MDEKTEEVLAEVSKHLNATSVAKSITKMVVRHSASAVVVTLIHTHMPDELLNRNRKIQLSIAAWAMGGAASDRAATWAANRVGAYVTLAERIVTKIKDPSDDSWSTATEEPTE